MAAAGFFVFTLEMLLLTSAISESLKFQFKSPSTSSTDVVLTPDLPKDFFKTQVILVKFNPIASHHLRRATYIYPILGADLCNNTTIVALEFCFRERKNQLNQRRSHFDFFTLVEQEQDPNVLEITYSATATSTLTYANCSDVPSLSTVICCSYQILPSPPPQSNVNYIGITNIREYPTLLRLPNGYNGSYSMRTVNIPAADFPIIDKRQFLQVDDGDMPALRMYYHCPPSPSTDTNPQEPPSNMIPQTVGNNDKTDSPDTLSSGNNKIILYAGIAGGSGLLILISITVIAAIIMTQLTRTRNARKKSMAETIPAPSDNTYNTLDTLKSTNKLSPASYSTLKQEWLPNLAHQSNSGVREYHEVTELQERQLPLLPQNPQAQHEKSPHYTNWSSAATPQRPGDHHVKPALPSRPTAYSLQSNLAYEDSSPKRTINPTYATIDSIEMEECAKREHNTPYAVPRH